MKPHTVLLIAPHPDDETLGCGGTFAKRILAGSKVMVVVLTDGRNLFFLNPLKIETDPTPWEISERRKEETRRSVEILGGSRNEIIFFDIEDGNLANYAEEASEKLAELIRRVSPDEIWVTSEYEEHPDHIAASGITRSALSKASCDAKLLRYITILKSDIKPERIECPRIIEDISEHLDTKRKAVAQFESHLKIVAKKQVEPLFKNADRWLAENEVFFVD